jgi:hypothetical protein
MARRLQDGARRAAECVCKLSQDDTDPIHDAAVHDDQQKEKQWSQPLYASKLLTLLDDPVARGIKGWSLENTLRCLTDSTTRSPGNDNNHLGSVKLEKVALKDPEGRQQYWADLEEFEQRLYARSGVTCSVS